MQIPYADLNARGVAACLGLEHEQRLGIAETHRRRGAASQPSRLLVQSGNGAILYLKPFKDAAQSFAVEGIAAAIHGRAELESVISTQAQQPNSGLIVMLDAFNINHRREITSGCSLPLPWCLSATYLP